MKPENKKAKAEQKEREGRLRQAFSTAFDVIRNCEAQDFAPSADAKLDAITKLTIHLLSSDAAKSSEKN